MSARYFPLIAVRIRSWHLTETFADSGLANYWTLCGRDAAADAATRITLPGGEKTCERCAVIAVKRGLVVPDRVSDQPEPVVSEQDDSV